MDSQQKIGRTKLTRDAGPSPSRQLRCVLVVGMALFWGTPVWSSLITAEHRFAFEYTYLPKCTSFDQTGACTKFPESTDVPQERSTTTIGGPGNSTERIESAVPVFGADELYAEFELGSAEGGKVKSNMQIVGRGDNSGENQDILLELSAGTVNLVTFETDVSTADPRASNFAFRTDVTGSYNVLRDYTDVDGNPGFLYDFDHPQSDQPAVTFENRVYLSGELSSPTGQSWSDWAASLLSGSGSTPPGGNQTSNPPVNASKEFEDKQGIAQAGQISDTHEVNATYIHSDLIYSGSPTTFSFTFMEALYWNIYGMDTGYWFSILENDLSNTITTYASVFDADGNLLPDARVQSSDGFEFAPLPEYANHTGNNVPVSAPAPAALIVTGLLGLYLRRWAAGKSVSPS